MFENLTVKQKQRWLAIGLGVLFLGLILIGSYFSEKKEENRVQEKVRSSKKMTLLTDKVEKDLWIAAEGQNIKALEKSNEELRSRLEQLARELDDTKKELKKKESAPPKLPPVPPPKPSQEKEKEKSGRKTDPEFPPPEEFTPFSPAKPTLSQRPERERPERERDRRVEPQPSLGSSIKVFKEEAPKDPKERKEPDRKSGKDRQKDEAVFLPSGSFMKAVTLSGLDAPTSGGSQSEPYPVLLGVTDLSVLPNRFRMNLRECFIIGAGYGNLSDERAYIRTETLSCVRSDGGVVDVSLKGHVIGEDGKLGMRGRLVSKQGQKIAMALVAGVLGSFGDAFRPQSATVLQLDPSKSGVFRYNPADILQAGALGGAGNALNKVAEYYLKMADKVFPIIEVDAGREVEVIVLKGQELKIQRGG